MKKAYSKIIQHYENCLDKYGDNHLGVDWPKLDDVEKRYKIMLDLVKCNEENDDLVSLLDFGCGTAHLLEFMNRNKYERIVYSGLDISQKFVDVAKKKHPEISFYCIDILDSAITIQNYDYIVMNGIFTEKRELTFNEMWDYFTKMLLSIFERCNKGFAFNVMSKNVEWEREDLFHISHDLLSDFLCKNLTRNYIIRNDYGLFEYTVYVLKK